MPEISPYLPNSYYNSGQLTVNSTTAQTVATTVQDDASALPPVTEVVFLGLVKDSTALAPNADGGPPSDLNASLNRLKQSAQTIARFLATAQNPEELAAILIQASYSEEQNAVQQTVDFALGEMAEADAAAQEDITGANTLMQDAVEALALAMAGAVLEAAGGAVGFAGATKALGELSELGGEDSSVTQIPPEISHTSEELDVEPATGGSKFTSDVDDADDDDIVGDGDDVDEQPPPDSDSTSDVDNDGGGTNAEGGEETTETITIEGQNSSKAKSDHELALEGLRARRSRYDNVSQVLVAGSKVFQASSSYETSSGQAANQDDQARAQEYSAQKDFDQQQQQYYTQFLSQTQSFVDQMHQDYNGILGARTSMGQAVSNARATI